MLEAGTFASYLVAFGMAFMIAMVCALKGNISSFSGFSLNAFLASMATAIAVMCWIPILPFYMIIFSVLMVAGMLFMNKGGLG